MTSFELERIFKILCSKGNIYILTFQPGNNQQAPVSESTVKMVSHFDHPILQIVEIVSFGSKLSEFKCHGSESSSEWAIDGNIILIKSHESVEILFQSGKIENDKLTSLTVEIQSKTRWVRTGSWTSIGQQKLLIKQIAHTNFCRDSVNPPVCTNLWIAKLVKVLEIIFSSHIDV